MPLLAEDDQESALGARQLRHGTASRGELTIAADEWRLDSLEPSQPTRLSPHPDHAVGDERACLALQLQLLRRGPLEEGRDLPLRRGTHEHRPRRSRRLEPSGRVHRVTRRAVFDA